MITYIDLKIIDRDFRILSQLCTAEYRKLIDGGNGGTCDRIRVLKAWGLVESRVGFYGGHKLVKPLSDISFSYWLNAIRNVSSENAMSPTLHLLNRFEAESVDTILQYPPYRGENWTLPLDHAIGILSSLSDKKPTIPRLLVYPALKQGYLAHVFTRFSEAGVVYPVSRKGVVLAKPFDKLHLCDIMPVLSHVASVYSGMLHQVSDTKLVSLLPDTGER